MNNLNWLPSETIEQLKEAAQNQFNQECNNALECRDAFVIGFLEGINYLKDAIEVTAKQRK